MEINDLQEEMAITREKFIEIAKKISKIAGKNINEVIKEAFKNAGLELPKYQSISALYDFKKIKENDTLIFNRGYTRLDNGDVYLFNFKVLDNVYLLYGEYNKDFNTFILDDKGEKALKNDENIEVLGVLTHIERDL